MRLILITFFAMSALVFSGCAHTHQIHGSQDRMEIPAGVKVGIGSSEVKEGDKVSILKTECQQVASKNGSRNACSDKKIGEGLVLRVLDHDSAIIKPDVGLLLDSSMKVEKQ